MPQEKLKTILMQNFGGQTKCIVGNLKIENRLKIKCSVSKRVVNDSDRSCLCLKQLTGF